MTNAGSTHPELALGVGGRTRCRDLVALASRSLAEVEVVGWKQRSVRQMDDRSEVPEGRENIGDAVGVEETVACLCVECTSLWVGSFRALAYNDNV